GRPLRAWTGKASAGWVSGVWQTRRRRLFLVPGESPIGFRLPLGALPHLRPADYPYLVPADPMDVRSELPDPGLLAQAVAHRSQRASAKLLDVPRGRSAPAPAVAPTSASRVPVRTALTVEPRDGRLCVFMPPLERLEDYLELLTVVEAAAAEFDMPVHVEGYEPPPDP